MRVHCRPAAARWTVALALLACGLPGRAAWTPVEGTANSYDYVDLASVRADGTLRRVWTLHDLMEPDQEGDRSYRSLLEYHCPERRYRTLQTLFFAGAMASGRLTGRSSQPGAWRAVHSGSVSASIMAERLSNITALFDGLQPGVGN